MFAVEVKNLTKTFGTCVSFEGLTFSIKKGEVHALLGENGAGKSTLMKTIFGMHRPDLGGEMLIDGTPVDFSSSKDAIKHGIGMVHQHFMLVKPFTILQNVILGIEPRQILGTIDYKKARREVEKVNQLYNFNLDLNKKVEDLTVGMQQRVEILKTLCRDAKTIIFDEPTAVLTPQEIEEFLNIVRMLKKQGKTILLITHKMHEIKAVADRCTIIRKGKFIETVDVALTSENELASKMVGRKVQLSVNKNPLQKNRHDILKIERLNVLNNKGILALNDFSLTLKAGEIVGLAGIDGNGQAELADVLNGIRPVVSGKVIINNEDVSNLTPKQIYAHKLSVIPADRQLSGLVVDYEVCENFVLQNVSSAPFSRKGILNKAQIKKYAAELVERFDVRTPSLHSPASALSGGNQQKIILAREIANNPEVLVAFQPTRGLDVGAIEYIHAELLKLRDAGKAILLISYELDEVITLSDRIAVIYEGYINEELAPEQLSNFEEGKLKEKIGLCMAGNQGRHQGNISEKNSH
jgi:ABC-type uncharacterized transport system ATPase subunit